MLGYLYGKKEVRFLKYLTTYNWQNIVKNTLKGKAVRILIEPVERV
jgi:hypothetical protein